MRFVVDTNVFDLLLEEGLVATVNRLQSLGECELLTTYVQEDELAKVPDNLETRTVVGDQDHLRRARHQHLGWDAVGRRFLGC
jgi:hypothetical protein